MTETTPTNPYALLPGCTVSVIAPNHRYAGSMGKLLRRVVENGIPCGVLSVPQRDRWGKVKPKLFVSVVVPERSLHVMAPAPSAQPGRAGKTLSLRMLALWRRILNQFLVKAQMQQVDLAPEEKVFRANKRKIAEQSRRRNRRR